MTTSTQKNKAYDMAYEAAMLDVESAQAGINCAINDKINRLHEMIWTKDQAMMSAMILVTCKPQDSAVKDVLVKKVSDGINKENASKCELDFLKRFT